MALNHVNVTTAVTNHSKLDLSTDHVASMSFMVQRPVYYRHVIKGESINLNTLVTIRPESIVVPTYGRMRCNLRSFFVPWRCVFPQFDSFYTDVIGSNYEDSSLITNSPWFENGKFVEYLETHPYTEILTDPDAQEDFIADDNNRYIFTPEGRKLYSIMLALGYRINWSVKDNTHISALALLAYCKIYADWYANSQYLDEYSYLKIVRLCSYNSPTTALQLQPADVVDILEFVKQVVYDSDYFVSAWDNPAAPANSQQSVFTFRDPTSLSYFGSVANDPNGTPIMIGESTTPNQYLGTQYLHDALRKLQNYSKRHALAGARSIDRLLAQYGMTIDQNKVNPPRCVYIGSKSIDIKIGDVTSTANTAPTGQPSNLGDFAGRSFGQDSASWDYKADEMGILIVIASILPSGGYYQGMDRNNMHLLKTDFFNPDFDTLGVQSIQKRELYVSNNGNWGDGADYDGTFGFTGRYAEYKRPIAWVSGDIAFPSVFRGGSSWHLFRRFEDDNFVNISNMHHSLNFTRGVDASSFDRIFHNTDSDYNKFTLNFHHDVHVYAPCSPMFETYDFAEDAKKVTLDTNGSKVN